MLDLRPVGYVVGLIVTALGLTMSVPMATDVLYDTGNARAFLEAMLIACLCGGLTAIACQNHKSRSFSIREGFLLTVGIWTAVPFFGALPFVIGKPEVRLIDAYFEAVSGITTTGASVFVDVDSLPQGVTLWRGMLNWLGGLGIAFIAMIFLPVMRVGGMQFFRSEGFDTFGKVLPRATDIARHLFVVYVLLTLGCTTAYWSFGMPFFEAVAHSFATVATGGFSPRSASFTGYGPAIEYAASAFMIFASLPYIRYVQLVQGSGRPLIGDPQVRGYVTWVGIGVVAVALWRVWTSDQAAEPAFREALFNLVSIMSSTGFGTGDFAHWGSFAMIVGMWLGIIGACSGSSAAGLSVFRVQIMFGALGAAVRRIHAPNRVAPVRYAGRPVDSDTLDAIILYLGAYIVTFGVFSLLMVEFGLDFVSAVFAAWTSIGNIGYGYGPMVEATGTFAGFPDPAKVVMILAMLMGRLSLLSILVLLLPRFWRG
ncbi:MAG: TrkH family potassium uptake protein [Defluviimonas sp.]|nr:TrkH family potassium uptake protein [Paracoccaceae bacterium]MCC0065205.1 TrkH family potassium uptake protein [Defluviimonas sp.]